MFKKMLTTLSLACFTLCLNAQTAQEALSKLTFETPQALYHAKGESANTRLQPNTKARKAAPIVKSYIVNDEGNNAQWITTHYDGKKVFVSKSVMTKIEPQPFMLNKKQNIPFRWEGVYDGDDESDYFFQWRIGKVKGNSGLWLCQTFEALNKFSRTLRLGKMIGNVLVFKYCIHFEYGDYNPNPELVNKWQVTSQIDPDFYGEKVKIYILKAGPELMFKRGYDFHDEEGDYAEGGMAFSDIDLTKVTEPMVYALFKDVIDRGETDYFYLTSYSFEKQWNY